MTRLYFDSWPIRITDCKSQISWATTQCSRITSPWDIMLAGQYPTFLCLKHSQSYWSGVEMFLTLMIIYHIFIYICLYKYILPLLWPKKHNFVRNTHDILLSPKPRLFRWVKFVNVPKEIHLIQLLCRDSDFNWWNFWNIPCSMTSISARTYMCITPNGEEIKSLWDNFVTGHLVFSLERPSRYCFCSWCSWHVDASAKTTVLHKIMKHHNSKMFIMKDMLNMSKWLATLLKWNENHYFIHVFFYY